MIHKPALKWTRSAAAQHFILETKRIRRRTADWADITTRKGGTPKSMVNNEVAWRMLADRLSA